MTMSVKSFDLTDNFRRAGVTGSTASTLLSTTDSSIFLSFSASQGLFQLC
jgi:hypothetical protein